MENLNIEGFPKTGEINWMFLRNCKLTICLLLVHAFKVNFEIETRKEQIDRVFAFIVSCLYLFVGPGIITPPALKKIKK